MTSTFFSLKMILSFAIQACFNIFFQSSQEDMYNIPHFLFRDFHGNQFKECLLYYKKNWPWPFWQKQLIFFFWAQSTLHNVFLCLFTQNELCPVFRNVYSLVHLIRLQTLIGQNESDILIGCGAFWQFFTWIISKRCTTTQLYISWELKTEKWTPNKVSSTLGAIHLVSYRLKRRNVEPPYIANYPF